MTDQQYGDYQLEIYFDGVEGRTPGWGSALRWDDLTWPRCLTTLPILLKGIQYSDDVRRAKDYGWPCRSSAAPCCGRYYCWKTA
jgi:hypothetical protein